MASINDADVQKAPVSIWLRLLICNLDSRAIHRICSLNAHSGVLLFPQLADYSSGLIPIYLSAQTSAAHLHLIIHHPEPSESLQKMTPAWPGAWLTTAFHVAPQPAPSAWIWSTQGKHTLHLRNCPESLRWGKGPPRHHWPVHPARFWVVRVPAERDLAEIMLEDLPFLKAQPCPPGVQGILAKAVHISKLFLPIRMGLHKLISK